MALTILNNPGSYFSAQGDLLFVVYGTNYAQPNYQYINDIYIGGVLIATIKRIPQPDNHLGIFNIGDIIRAYVSANFSPVAAQLRAQELVSGEWFIAVQCKFGEQYSGTEYHNVTVDSSRTYFNNYNGRLLGVLTNLAAYTDKVVSNRPTDNKVNCQDTFCFMPYFPTTASPFNIVTKPYAGGVLQATNTDAITPTAANDLQIFNIAPSRIAGLNSATTHYTVQVNGGQIYTFTLSCEAIYTNYTIHFLNKYGGFESRDFSKVSRKTVDITKTDYGRLPYTVDSSGNIFYANSNNVLNQTRSVYSSQYKEKMTLNTDILTDQEYQWLGELFISTLVYIEMEGYFVSVTITQNNYEYKKRVNDKLTNIQMDIEFGEVFNAQFR